jgi:hypothetical protein
MSCITSFLEKFSELEYPRIPGLITYALDEILLASLCDIIYGNQDWEEIAYWSEYNLAWLRTCSQSIDNI